jgi:hypothetical protein
MSNVNPKAQVQTCLRQAGGEPSFTSLCEVQDKEAPFAFF